MRIILVSGIAAGAASPPNSPAYLPLFIGLFGGQLFDMLVSGQFLASPGRIMTRVGDPGTYWRWIFFHSLMIALTIALSVMTWLSPATL